MPLPKETVAESIPTGGSCLRVAIVGGGASGALLATRLLRDTTHPVRIDVFEPRPLLGGGIAYSTIDSVYLLNVPAGGMSALPEDMDSFRRWSQCVDTDFLPRATYAAYLRHLLSDAERDAVAGCTLTHVQQRVLDLGTQPSPWVQASDGSTIEVDVIILATGNDAPSVIPGIDAEMFGSPRFVPDPWSAGGLERIEPNDVVLILGTGLTFVDVCIDLANRVKGVRIDAVSRHGLIPLAHEDPWRPRHPAPMWEAGPVELRRILAYLRSFGADWRRGIDSMRPVTNDLWLGMDAATRTRFIRHLSRYWDVHRHRMAPGVASVFTTLVEAGRVRVERGTVVGMRVVNEVNEQVVTTFDTGVVRTTDRVVLCTGPSGDAHLDPLGARIIDAGVAQPGPFGTGFLVDPVTGALIDAAGVVDERILTIGPPRRGVLWETTAMPEIRHQAVDVAKRVLGIEPRSGS